ncbi:MAG TPA: monooxygenase, partial [Pantoea sp.]|nr:monooxygenase [Pantoea sp.]
MLKAKSLAKFHLIAAAAWAALTLPTLIWWKESILWVS